METAVFTFEREPKSLGNLKGCIFSNFNYYPGICENFCPARSLCRVTKEDREKFLMSFNGNGKNGKAGSSNGSN